MMDLACGTIGISESEFWELTIAGYIRLVESYNHQQYLNHAHMRIVATMILNTAFGNKKWHTPNELFPHPYDKRPKDNLIEVTPDQVKKIFTEDSKHLKVHPKDL